MPKINFNSDFKVGLGALVAGCLILFVWIPSDVETGLVEKVRSQVAIGDALAHADYQYPGGAFSDHCLRPAF